MKANYNRRTKGKIILISLLTVIILIIITILCSTKNFLSITKAETATTVDLTGLSTGQGVSHNHVFESKYDNTAHWEQCVICDIIRNRQNHTLETVGNPATCDVYVTLGQEICKSNCGYSKQIQRLEHIRPNPMNWVDYLGHRHMCFECERCGGSGSNGAYEAHVFNINGQLLTVSDMLSRNINIHALATKQCTICKLQVDLSKHKCYSNFCYLCNRINGPIVNFNVSQNNIQSSKIKVDLINNTSQNVYFQVDSKGFELTRMRASSLHGGNYQFTEPVLVSRNGNIYLYRTTVSLIDRSIPLTEDIRVLIGAYTSVEVGDIIEGYKMGTSIRGESQYTIDPEVTPATISSITATSVEEKEGWATIKRINVKGSSVMNKSVYISMYDPDGKPVFERSAATVNNNYYDFNVTPSIEVNLPEDFTVKVEDIFGNTITKKVSLQKIDSKAPTISSPKVYNTPWTKEKLVKFEAIDKGIGNVKIAFNIEADYGLANYENGKYGRLYRFIGDVYKDVVGALYIKDGLGNVTLERVTIGKIDNTAPTVTNINQTVAKDRRSSTLDASAHDENALLKSLGKTYVGSGVKSYAITEENVMPDVSKFQSSSEFTVTKNGKYYIWAMDNVGNISNAKEVLVKDLVINIIGKIEYEDIENKYNSRSNQKIWLYRRVGEGQEELAEYQEVTKDAEAYIFETRECNDLGEYYTFRIEAYELGYLTTYEGNNITGKDTKGLVININNELILPEYSSNIEYQAYNNIEDMLLKNGKVKIIANIENKSNTYMGPGINNGKIVINIDKDIYLERTSLKVLYKNAQGILFGLLNYTLEENVLTIDFKDRALMANEQIIIEAIGKTVELKEYKSEMTLTGNLTSYNGEKTEINLGEILKTGNSFVVENQMPRANIKFKKVDSITNEDIVDAEFTLYEWTGNGYTEREKITDENSDGYYESKYYEWNNISEGKLKIQETKVPKYHKNNGISIEFEINSLKEEDYTIEPGYEESDYKINYEILPDALDRKAGTLENEPYKLKARIYNIDSQTEQIIKGDAKYRVYEWNNETNSYEEYMSYTSGEKVQIPRQEDRTYLVNDWMYYTKKNEGKYRIIEQTAAYGYYGDYQEEKKDKRMYDINIIEIIESGKYNKQDIKNEGTIQIYNNTDRDNTFENKRAKGEINVQLIDTDTLENKIQGQTTLKGAEYAVYAKEQINHADGKTTRYEGEEGVLFKKDELVTISETNEKGRVKFTDLECGKYYIKQIKPSYGYMPDKTEYEFDLEYKGQQIQNLSKDLDINVKVALFDMKVEHWINKVILIEDGVQKIRLTGLNPNEDLGKIIKIDLNKKRIENTIIKFAYVIKVTNVGELPGSVSEIVDTIPKGLEFIKEENKNWERDNKKIISTELQDIVINPGESKEINLVLKWENSGNNIGEKENKVEITKTSNEYNIEEIDARAKDRYKTNNVSISTSLFSIITGGENIKIYVTIGIIFTCVVALGVILIKKYII